MLFLIHFWTSDAWFVTKLHLGFVFIRKRRTWTKEIFEAAFWKKCKYLKYGGTSTYTSHMHKLHYYVTG